MELICDVIIRDRRTGIVVNEAKSISSAIPIVDIENENVKYKFNFEFSTVVDKRIVDQIDRMGGRECLN